MWFWQDEGKCNHYKYTQNFLHNKSLFSKEKYCQSLISVWERAFLPLFLLLAFLSHLREKNALKRWVRSSRKCIIGISAARERDTRKGDKKLYHGRNICNDSYQWLYFEGILSVYTNTVRYVGMYFVLLASYGLCINFTLLLQQIITKLVV